MTPPTYYHDPDAVLDYVFDWAAWLAGDTLVASTWLVTVGITLSDPSFTTTTTTVWVEGGAAGFRYELTNHIVTAAGREEDRMVRIEVRDH